MVRLGLVHADCLWSANGNAWLDANSNGVREPDEPPFPDVEFHVATVGRPDIDVGSGSPSVADWQGEATLEVWLPGCAEQQYEMYADVPSGYRLTTPARFSADSRDPKKTYSFGFATLAGVPTATARPPSPICKAYPIGVYGRDNVTDLALAFDGTVWASTFGNGVVRYIQAEDRWVRYTQAEGLVDDRVYSITPLPDGSVWFGTEGGAARWARGEWTSVTTTDGLIDNVVMKVAQGTDGSLWFSTIKGATQWTPATDQWTTYTSANGLADDFAAYVGSSPDGSIWVATFDGLSRWMPGSGAGTPPQWVVYSPYQDGDRQIPTVYIQDIQVGPDGQVWFGSSQGLFWFDPATQTWGLLGDASPIGSFHAYVNGLEFAPDGTLWIAANGDTPRVYHIDPVQAANQSTPWLYYDDQDGLPRLGGSDRVEDYAVAVGIESNSVVWVATKETATRCIFHIP